MATYRCLQSGNTVTFTMQVDIDSMKGHPGYVQIDEETQEEKPLYSEEERKDIGFTPVRKRGRPKGS